MHRTRRPKTSREEKETEFVDDLGGAASIG
jgi:hypothetical protein